MKLQVESNSALLLGSCDVVAGGITGTKPGRSVAMKQTQQARLKAPQDRILETAAELFARYGYSGTSTKEIAARAKVNEVTIYRNFRQKRALYCAALESELAKVQLRGD